MDKLTKVGAASPGKSNWIIGKDLVFTLMFVILIIYVYPLLGFTTQEIGAVLLTMSVYIAGISYINKQPKESWQNQRIAKR